jgi:hypothetical protein
MAVDIISRVLGGELAGAGEIEEKRVVVADPEAIMLIFIPRLCSEPTNAVSIENLEERDCPSFVVSSFMKISVLPSMIRSSIFEDSLIDLLPIQVCDHLFNLLLIRAL